ncbi:MULTISPECIES: hypothetical protein [unclassified Bradyrhizobium]|uniref:hypothetical protein n=1 Tax=unclassified Bradyrhizobium TaxID=2631580 RepID=UPI003393C1CE
MPLIKYFGFVGSALVLWLVGLGWCLPQQQVMEPTGGSTERPAIRIASAERVPERVVIDTSFPTIVSPPSVLEFAERWPQTAVAAVVPPPKIATATPVGDVPTKPTLSNRERSKKLAVHQSNTNIKSSRNDKATTSPAVAELSLLDSLKEGLGQAQEKLVASLESVTTNASKSRLEKRR